jgi:hypothetical protein
MTRVFFENKYWTWEELFALVNKESTGGKRILLPIRLGLDHFGVAPLARTDYCSVKGVKDESKKRGVSA